MPCPFPGMDPYLEDPALWPAFHHLLVAMLQQVLLAPLGVRYKLHIAQRRYEAAGAQYAEDFLEIRRQSDDRLVTHLDVVSPSNKTTDAGRQVYLQQRRQARESSANIVETDLVLQGQPTLEYSREGLPDWKYAVTVTRAAQPDRFEIYTATLQKRLPRFRLPLDQNERDCVVDLQAAFTRCYTEGGYAERIDYNQEPPGPLTDEDRRRLDATLVAQGLRKPSPPHEEIARLAYAIWEQEGHEHGRDKEHWHEALARLRHSGPVRRERTS